MVIFRILAQILIAAALMVLSADAVQSLEAGEVRLRTLSEFSALLHLGDPTAALSAWAPGVFKDGLSFLVALPAWVILGFIGVVLAWATAPRD